MATTAPEVPMSSPFVVFLVVVFFFPAWRFYSILVAQKKEKREGHDWTASLWFSPILKNPQSWVMTGGAALSAAGVALISACLLSGRSAFVGLFSLTFGLGVLTGLITFRIRNEKTA